MNTRNVFYKNFVICFLLHVIGVVTEIYEPSHIVTIKSGKIKGIILKSNQGRDYHAFMSIPYGKSTAGLLRFKPPRRVDPWDGIYDAGKLDSVECAQTNVDTGKPTGTEDCLVVNVYVPQVSIKKSEKDASLPVLVFIHGGAFAFGSAAYEFYGPHKFMDVDVILVTFNYRVGIFGFFNTEDSVSPGNYGMLDQVLALRWVNENIANFGGDPELITVFGESAGGASVVYHMISPLTQGLFKNAIAQSGSALNPWAFQEKPLKWAHKLAEVVHCPTTDTQSMFDCFQQSSLEKLVEGSQQLVAVEMFPPYPAPSVEGPGGEGYLTDSPAVLMKEHKIHKVPFFNGICKDEGYFFYFWLSQIFKNDGQKFLNEDFSRYLSLVLNVDSEMNDLVSAVKKEYFENVKIDDPKIFKKHLILMLADSLINAGVTKTTDLFNDAGIPTFAFLYTFKGQLSYISRYGESSDYVTHIDDAAVQFKMSQTAEEKYVNDTKMSHKINSLWATIAAGKELLIDEDNNDARWDLYDAKNQSYLNLNLQPRIENGKFSDKDTFWVDVVPKLIKEYSVKDEL